MLSNVVSSTLSRIHEPQLQNQSLNYTLIHRSIVHLHLNTRAGWQSWSWGYSFSVPFFGPVDNLLLTCALLTSMIFVWSKDCGLETCTSGKTVPLHSLRYSSQLHFQRFVRCYEFMLTLLKRSLLPASSLPSSLIPCDTLYEYSLKKKALYQHFCKV